MRRFPPQLQRAALKRLLRMAKKYRRRRGLSRKLQRTYWCRKQIRSMWLSRQPLQIRRTQGQTKMVREISIRQLRAKGVPFIVWAATNTGQKHLRQYVRKP